MALNLRQWSTTPTHQAKDIILRIISGAQAPIPTRDVYQLALNTPIRGLKQKRKEAAAQAASTSESNTGTPQPPNPHHPVRSMTFLKRNILPQLEKEQLIKRVHIARKLSPEEIEHRLRASASSKIPREKRESALQRLVIDEWGWLEKKVKFSVEDQIKHAIKRVDDVEENLRTAIKSLDRKKFAKEQAKKKEDEEWMRQVAEVRERAAAAARAQFESQSTQ
ncbi:hypothetical protein PUNSTDRAFT_143728 [Punctularia strigosozonata HHB-11173 SS5]|uniref:uncharacterized protein n=1 Tax=Punctularia strigosozonata (strain HHB-11173) TaxID=741275 RepID=UPI0004417CFF|nr:uncharacterized protein PUNSTDRAFT_143728 [Punctularia strigosozonata HHB-11173 SS5]EIN09143.1 hypothetical protein PUNSTDRAFT_143728 [Punctularia strigosozonata HHB-11173 SS5]